MKRREFIQVGSFGVAGAALLGGVSSNWYNLYGDPLRDPGTDGDQVIPTFCELCFWKCGVLAHVKDGRVTKIKGNPKDPLSRGHLCPRGVGATGLLYDPDRLKKPMIRVNKRGSHEFEEVSWDAVLNEVAENFDESSYRGRTKSRPSFRVPQFNPLLPRLHPRRCRRVAQRRRKPGAARHKYIGHAPTNDGRLISAL